VLLRVSVAIVILLDASGGLSALAPPLVFGGLVLAAIALCLGFATPLASVIGCLFQFAGLILVDRWSVRLGTSIASSLALALLGPGAYSIDARLFGRWEIVIPHKRIDE
jgi:uncharacterized membrane protein YphA (DoxX/SURF4 family)